MAWTLNGTRIFVQDNVVEGSQIIPRLQPISGTTILQFFGWEGPVRNVSGLIVGDTDKDALMALYKTGNSYELMSPMGDLGDYFVKKVSPKQIPNVCQTLRPDLPEDSPMYNVDLELYLDE